MDKADGRNFRVIEFSPEVKVTSGKKTSYTYNSDGTTFLDCLTDMHGAPVHIVIIGLEVLERKFGDAARKMIEILK